MKNIFLLSLILLFSCASQGIPSGGAVDKEGPIITDFIFESRSILENEPMVILFNEIINPLSVKQSIKINGQNDFSIRVKYNKVIIYPLDKWDDIIELTISRKISDYQNNIMEAPVSKIFKIESTDFFKGIIKGKLFNIISDKIYEIALYKIKNNDLIYIKKTESDINGDFKFQNIDNGQYRLCALEGSIKNFEEDYRFHRYGIQSQEIIINSQKYTFNTNIMIDNPLPRERIVGAEILNGNYGLLTLSDGTEKSIYIESNRDSKSYITGDSIYLNFDYYNRLEIYSVPSFNLIANINQDTLSPKIDSYYLKNKILHINFSEPIKLLKTDPFFNEKGRRLDYNIIDHLNLTVDVNDYNNIHIYENSIADFNNNLIDSLMIVDFSVLEISEQKFGSLKGTVNYKDLDNIVLRLSDINSDNKYHTLLDMQDSSFIFQDILPGEYILDSYELKHLNPEIYYSGVWGPFMEAARFTIYPEHIDIRAHWVIEGIEIIYD